MRIVLGITGGIAAYKTPDLIRLLAKENISTICVLTQNAKYFVTKTTLETVSRNPVLTGMFDADPYCRGERLFAPAIAAPHLDLSNTTDALVIAPATANIIAKCAHGIADDLLTTLFLSHKGPKLIVPAMHTEMYNNPLTQENIKKLKSIGVHFLGPDYGDLACGDTGLGRMAEPVVIVEKIKTLAYPPLNLKGKKILITAGGTTEHIDNVRVITNLSTGKMGQTLAATAAFMGAEVCLITTKPVISNPEISEVIKVNTVEEMALAVKSQIKNFDYLFMTAAVSDFTPVKSGQKLKRQAKLNLKLTGTTDILKSLKSEKNDKTFVGFCLADENLEKTAKLKLKEKNLDYIIANKPNVIGQNIRSCALISHKPQNIIRFNNISIDKIAYNILKSICK